MYSRLTPRYQTTLPQRVREFLGVKPGDVVKYEIADGRRILSKAPAREVAQLGQVKRPPRVRDMQKDAAASDEL